jgi:hypothetical protein
LRSFNHTEKTPGCYHWDSVTANTIIPPKPNDVFVLSA